jgi:mutator protein MutT
MKNKKQMCAVVGLIRDENRRILLRKRVDRHLPDAHGKWEFPGGKIDFWESPEDALRRECREEIGCEVEVKRLLPEVQSKRWTRPDGKRYHVLVFCFEVEIVRGEPQVFDRSASEVGWFEEEDILKLDTLGGIDEFVSLSEQEGSKNTVHKV